MGRPSEPLFKHQVERARRALAEAPGFGGFRYRLLRNGAFAPFAGSQVSQKAKTLGRCQLSLGEAVALESQLGRMPKKLSAQSPAKAARSERSER